MKTYLILFAIASIIKALSLDKFLRLVLLRVLYPKATIKQIESFEKNTKRNDFAQWYKNNSGSD